MTPETLAAESCQPAKAGSSKQDVVRKHIRGSSLLLFGRFISLALNFLAQILIVRHLSTSEYGAWAYALSVVLLCQSFATLGLERSITRFVPLYHEKRDYDLLFGTIVLVLVSILVISALFLGGFYLIGERLPGLITNPREPLLLLSILILLVPLEAADRVLVGLFASFSSARSIFFRKHVLGPLLKLLAVVLLIWSGARISFLAYGYVLATLAVIVIYGWLLLHMLRRQALLQHFKPRQLKFPISELAAFSLPLLLGDLLSTITFSTSSLMLGHYFGTVEVAYYRVVLPAAILNRLVMQSFIVFYTPTAARLFAREDMAGVNRLYWQTSMWMSALSFPIFAATFALSDPITVLFYGARYEHSGIVLAILALGNFVYVALGFNDLTLRVLGKYRYIILVNLGCMVATVVINIALVPKYGAVGAAIATTLMLIVQPVLKQVGLMEVPGLKVFDKQCVSFCGILAAATAVLFLAKMMSANHLYVACLLSLLASAAVLLLSRGNLDIKDTFPESLRVPFLKRLVA